MVLINDIEPDDNGDITIIIKKGPDAIHYWGYYGLNSIIVLPEGTNYEFPGNDFQLENPVLIDFGLWISGTPWQNLRDSWDPASHLSAALLNLHDKESQNTKFALATTGGFSAVNDLGAFGNKLGLPDEVAVDAFWGDRWMSDGELTVSNLNKSEKYIFVFYGSRRDMGDNRETKYEVIGENSGIDFLNASNNVENVAVVKDIIPDAFGNIRIKVTVGPNNNSPDGHYYLNTMIFGPEGFDFIGF